MTMIKSISVSEEFNRLAKEHRISWSEAARVGVSLLLSEIGVKDYDNKLNIVRRMKSMADVVNKKCQEIEELESRLASGTGRKVITT